MPTFSATPIVAALVALLCFAIFSRMVFADVGFSGGFKLDQSVNDFGGQSTSSSFQSVTTGGQFVTGESTSSNFQLAAGYEYSDSFAPKQKNWRWYDDELNETPNTALDNENVAPSDVFNDNIIKLRVTVRETAGIGQAGSKFRLQFATSTDFFQPHDVTDRLVCTGSSVWCYADGAGVDNAIISSGVLTDSDSCSGGVGTGCGTHNESSYAPSTFTHLPNAATEYEFTIVSHATAASTAYFFRLYDTAASSSVPLDTGETFPSLTVHSGSLTFIISGVSANSSTGGVTTDIDTTSTDVPFGALPIGNAITGAQTLNVSTNANTGFEVYAFVNQNLIGASGQEIIPFSGTNISPASWTTGCTSGTNGCFGYHTTESVLAGGSARFAADDTYAGFTQQPSEIAYSSGPAVDHTTDVVYKIEAHDRQAAGEYQTNLIYVVVPVF